MLTRAIYCFVALVSVGHASSAWAACSGYGPGVTSFEIRPTGKIVKYKGDVQVKNAGWVKSAQTEGFNLILEIEHWSKYLYFEAPEVQEYTIIKQEARPDLAILRNVILLGLPLLFDPKLTVDTATGCKTEYPLKTSPDKDNQKELEEYVWETTSPNYCKLSILVSDGKAFSKEYPVQCGGIEELSIQQEVMSGQIDVLAPLKISCPNCGTALFDQENAPPRQSISEIQLISRFDVAREKELARLRALELEREENELLAKIQADTDKALAEAQRRKVLRAQEDERKAALERERERARQKAIKERLDNL